MCLDRPGLNGVKGLEGARILLISPRFFGYEKRILERLRERGAEVEYVDDRPDNSVLTKLSVRLDLSFFRARFEAYHESVLKNLQGRKFDHILFIVPETCSVAIVKKYQEAFPEAKTRLYMWDSFENKVRLKKNAKSLVKMFDQCFTFDRKDCEEFGIHFRPLFFCGNTAEAPRSGAEYAFSFIGTIHSDRYRILKRVADQARTLGQTYFLYPFLPSYLHYLLYKCTKWDVFRTPKNVFQFSSLPYAEVLRVIANSIAIIDIEHPRQRGLTMRTIEVIASERKLITTNCNVKDYRFYSPDRVLVVDRKAPELPRSFFDSHADPVCKSFLSAYSLDGWIDDVFGVNGSQREVSDFLFH